MVRTMIAIYVCTYASLLISAELGLASKVISASESSVALAATVLITASTVEGLAKLGVPAWNQLVHSSNIWSVAGLRATGNK